jgi:hypothetical protein
MTKRVGDVVFIYPEKPQQCDECGKIAEVRPYGKNGACLCFECSEKPENKIIVEENMNRILWGGK